jgi:hypothetical protein
MSGARANSPPSVLPTVQDRRASLAPGSSLTDLLSRPGGSNARAASPPYTGPITTAAVNAQSNHRRRLSITTLGLSGSPNQTSPFGSRVIRPGSLSSSVGSSSPNNEEAVDDSEVASPSTTAGPFGRRLSFGAQALRDVRGGNNPGSGRCSLLGSPLAINHLSFPCPASSDPASDLRFCSQRDVSDKSRRQLGEGFNWSEAFRTRAERAPSLGGFFSTSPQGPQPPVGSPPGQHHRATSMSIIEEHTREMPKQPRDNKPDFFQEKILRADFMD